MSGLWTWDPETDAVTWSASVAGLYGVPVDVTTYDEQLGAVHPDDRELVNRDWVHLVTSGVPGRSVYRSVAGNHLASQAQLISVQGRPFVVGAVRAIARPDGEEERRFADLFRNFPTGVALVTDEGFFVEVNEALLAMLGYAREDLVGTKFQRVVHPDEAEAVSDRFLAAEGRRHGRAERRLVRADGSVLWALVNSRRYEEEESTWSVVAVEDITERKHAEDQLVVLALHDSLTGLPNRRLLLDRLEHALARSRRDGRDVAVLFIDLDHVKRVNDALGHEAGDELLIAVAKNLQAVVRSSDTVARLGGDEFVVVCEQSGGLPELEALANRMLEAIRMPIVVGHEQVTVTASIGLVTPSSATDRPQDLLRAADAAMYLAKQGGRGRVVIGTAPLDDHAPEALTLEADIRRALDTDEFVLHFQPMVAMSGQVLAVEALLRWRHPERGLLVPEQFLAVVNASPMASAVAEWVLRRALGVAAGWGTEGPPVAVNVTVDRLRDRTFADLVLAACQDAGLPPAQLQIEILEDQLAETAQILDVVQRLRAAGVGFAVDDFGTGYSSLAYLKQLPIGVVKIDRSFITTICDDPADASIVKAVLDACRATGRLTVAEGVETVEQLSLLRTLGCDAIQGALVAMPLPLELIAPVVSSGWVELPAEVAAGAGTGSAAG
jgi:diguanylate cyclase (GGDEF)-like protein/PAS domain S-box-containing protein